MADDVHDALIIGAGPIGLAMARALNVSGVSACLCGELPTERMDQPDLRTAALFSGSIRLLERLGAWQHLKASATPLMGIRIVDDTGHLLRAPEQMFAASDIEAQELGYNVPNAALVDALKASIKSGAPLQGAAAIASETHLGVKVTDLAITDDYVTATLDDGSQRHGRIAVAADGRRSMARQVAGIEAKTWQHAQSAITAHFSHALPNEGVSTEVHTSDGPCTIVPLGPHRASLVWMTDTEQAQRLHQLDDEPFTEALEAQLQGLLGPLSDMTPRGMFPLLSLLAERFAGQRVALIGEAGHAFPPIGAQGLNLGLRDVASLTGHITRAIASNSDPGSPDLLDAYDNERRADVTLRTYGVDAFNRSLSGRAAGLVRGAVLHAAGASPRIKQFLITRGLEPVGDWPALMRQGD